MNPPICYGFMILLSYQELVAHKKIPDRRFESGMFIN